MAAFPTPITYAEDIAGKTFLLVGQMTRWPMIMGMPADVIQQRGGIIADAIMPPLDYLILTSRRDVEKTKALQSAKKLNKAGAGIKILDDADLAHLLRPKLGKAGFYIAGGFDCCPDSDGPTHPRELVKTIGRAVHETPTKKTRFALIGQRRSAGKAEAERLIAPFLESQTLTLLTEAQFLEMVAIQRKPGRNDGIAGLFLRMQTFFDAGKLERAMKMLKTQRMHLFADVTPRRIMGIVQSQRSDGVYACHLDADGVFSCRNLDLSSCMGQGGGAGECKACKHLVVLLLGLVNEELLDGKDAERWISLAASKGVSRRNEVAAEAILKYKGVQAGEVDWRPIETMPEDYYAV